METYIRMIKEYKEEIGRLQTRLDEITGLMNEPHSGADMLGDLNRRRYKLYQMVWELEDSVRQMEDYVSRLSGRDRAVPVITAVITGMPVMKIRR